MLNTFHDTVKKDANVSLVRTLLLLLVFINTIVLKVAFVDNENWYKALFVTLPLLFVCFAFNTIKISRLEKTSN